MLDGDAEAGLFVFVSRVFVHLHVHDKLVHGREPLLLHIGQLLFFDQLLIGLLQSLSGVGGRGGTWLCIRSGKRLRVLPACRGGRIHSIWYYLN